MSEPKQTQNWLVIGLVVVIGYLLYNAKSAEPTPAPKPDDVKVLVSDSVKELCRLYGNAFSNAAQDITDGKIKTDAQMQQALSNATRAARQAAFSPIDGHIQDSLPRKDGELLPDSAEFVKALGTAFAEAAR